MNAENGMKWAEHITQHARVSQAALSVVPYVMFAGSRRDHKRELSIRKISKVSGLHWRTVDRGVNDLYKSGLLEVTGNGPSNTTMFNLTIPSDIPADKGN